MGKQYVNQKRKVYQLLGLDFNDQIIDNDIIFGDDIQSDIDDDDHSNNDDDDKFNHNSSDSPSSDSFLSDNIHNNKRCKISKKKKMNNGNNGKREFQGMSMNDVSTKRRANKKNNKKQ